MQHEKLRRAANEFLGMVPAIQTARARVAPDRFDPFAQRGLWFVDPAHGLRRLSILQPGGKSPPVGMTARLVMRKEYLHAGVVAQDRAVGIGADKIRRMEGERLRRPQQYLQTAIRYFGNHLSHRFSLTDRRAGTEGLKT
ncbi:MAG: hypothetical protein ACK4FJ_15325 [Ferrovibrio sp.]|uniref:hypothetical protein n=1 Tax=Ferrovibrio sp. TaxID=1917215 RepID=UPI00391DC551